MTRNVFRITLCLAWMSAFTQPTRASSPPPVEGAVEPATAANLYGEGVRSTPWQSPADELAGFHLPPGFEIRLFASEPQIAKPLNLAHDDQGRLWLTQSTRYPYPYRDGDPEDKAADAVIVLQDVDGDGFAEQSTTFADGLNIPIGILPYGDGCLCFSIPNILYLRDLDGDGTCDRRDVILGPFDTTRDTHGMVNAMRDGGDGWIYACHGFNNQSSVAGSDGHRVTLQSGNTFRFRPDGSRVEKFTQGQVNPFGLTTDDWGYLYSADCHSKPITQLIHGACYPSFGRPDDGLGFLPPMVDHLHGSTAISGIQAISPRSTMLPLRGQIVSGNVMTSRLNRNRLTYQGATARGEELPDFLTSDDPWFRPVDIRLGPDGYLYVADFYNRIIGHYEVPLEHPGRDRTSGRIWQIRYTASPHDSDASSSGETQEIVAARDRLQTLRDLSDPVVVLSSANRLLSDENAHVARLAAERLGDIPVRDENANTETIRRLLARLQQVDPQDPVLRQTIRIAIARRLRQASPDSQVWRISETAETSVTEQFVDILPAIDSPPAFTALLDFIAANPNTPRRDQWSRHVAERATPQQLPALVKIAREIAGSDPQKQSEWLERIWMSAKLTPEVAPIALREWIAEWTTQQFQAFEDALDKHSNIVGWHSDRGIAWPQQSRQRSDGRPASLSSSILWGEQYVGTQHTETFAAPNEIRFWLAGHNGLPSEPDHHKNFVRLLNGRTGEELERAFPPRNDVAVLVRWDTANYNGQPVRVECTDGDGATAYAWLALGDFSPAWLNPVAVSQSLDEALQWTERANLIEQQPRLTEWLKNTRNSPDEQLKIAQTIAALRGHTDVRRLLQALQQQNMPSAELLDADVPIAVLTALLDNDTEAFDQVARTFTTRLTLKQQQQFAIQWVRGAGSVDQLLEMGEHGWLAADVFADDDLQQSLAPKLNAGLRARVDQLSARATAVQPNETLTRLRSKLDTMSANAGAGQPLFKQHCAACHQLRGDGNVVGPQLDGAIARPPDRLLEDLLTPNRNLDLAFRTTSFLTDDGRVLVGLIRNETDTEIQLIDSQGKPLTVLKNTVEVRKPTERSLMPNNFDELLTDQQIADLLAFLKRAPDSADPK